MSIIEYIQYTALYIEEHIKQSLSLEQICERVGLSKFYLNRIFSALTGQTLMAYVNRRKLVSSLHELQNTEMRIVDIAEEYGFSFESAFIRSFKREFGSTPDAFRRTKCEIPVTAPITSGILSAIGESSILVKPSMIFKPAFFVTGDRCHARLGKGMDAFQRGFYNHRRPLIKNSIDRHVTYGHNLYDDNDTYWYTACVEVENDRILPPEGMVTFQIPESNYWVFKYIKTHDLDYIAVADFKYVLEGALKWFSVTGEQRSVCYFEKIDHRKLNDTYFEMDFYFPVVEKKDI